ncbi:MAG: hypothetical protein ABJG78_16700 [Cyclobacteriaceae bacterium]
MSEKESVKKIGKTMDKRMAKKWVKNYQKKHEDGTYGWLYGCDILCKLLEYPGAEGIWFYKGINEEGKERLVLYPADANGKILDTGVKSLGAMASRGDDDAPADYGKDCPPFCG